MEYPNTMQGVGDMLQLSYNFADLESKIENAIPRDSLGLLTML
jgi:hypothetical protein